MMEKITLSMETATGFMRKNLVLQKPLNGVKKVITLLIITLTKLQFLNLILLFMTNCILQIINLNTQKQAKKIQL